MKHPNIKPLDILWQDGIASRAFAGIITGLWDILQLAGVANQLPVVSRGMVPLPSFLDKKEVLKPRVDIEPFLEIARQQSKRSGFLHAAALLNALRNTPDYKSQERYALLIVQEKIHWDNPDIYSEKAGCAFPGYNAVISLASYGRWFNPQDFGTFLLLTRMVTIHELGHVFRLGITQKSGASHEEIESGHCKNNCVMSLNTGIEFRESIQDNPLCPSCLENFRAYFTATP